MSDQAEITRHDDRGRFELAVEDRVVAFAEFSQDGDVMTIPHIETAIAHRGRGYSSELMDGVIADVRSRNIRVHATCAVARAHIAAHAPELLTN